MSKPADVKKGHLWVLMTKVVIPLAKTPMDYVNQLQAIGGTPDRDYVDRKYLDYRNNGVSEEWRFEEKLWRWDGPCKIERRPRVTKKTYNIPDGFRKETFHGDKLVEITYTNENGERHRMDGPSVKRFLNGILIYESWHHNGYLVEQNEPSVIRYFENGTVKRKMWRRNREFESVDYNEDGIIETRMISVNDPVFGMRPLVSNTKPYRIEYDENGEPETLRYNLGNGDYREESVKKQ